MKLPNIKFKDYIAMSDRTMYDYAIKHGITLNRSVDHLKIGDLKKKPFGFVKELQELFSTGDESNRLIEIMCVLGGITLSEFGNFTLVDAFQSISFIRKEIEEISFIESEMLSYTPTGEDLAAGIEDFAKYGSYTQVRALCQAWALQPREVEGIDYSTCFLELCYQADSARFDKRKMELQRAKS